jgi:hypothetical protein
MGYYFLDLLNYLSWILFKTIIVVFASPIKSKIIIGIIRGFVLKSETFNK